MAPMVPLISVDEDEPRSLPAVPPEGTPARDLPVLPLQARRFYVFLTTSPQDVRIPSTPNWGSESPAYRWLSRSEMTVLRLTDFSILWRTHGRLAIKCKNRVPDWLRAFHRRLRAEGAPGTTVPGARVAEILAQCSREATKPDVFDKLREERDR